MNLLLHDQTRARLAAIEHARTGSYIFHGGRSMGKATAAYELARKLNCQGDSPALCGPCKQFAAGSYPDLITIRPQDKPSILIEQIRTLSAALSLSLYHPNGIRLVVIDGAHLMTTEAGNALLKLIEEPPPQTIFVLIAEQLESLLPTVRSRCAAIYFPKLSENQIKALLSQKNLTEPNDASDLAATDGAPGLAIMLADNPAEAQSRLELNRQAAGAIALGTFERLLLAARLVAAKADLPRFAQILHHQLIDQTRTSATSPVAAASQLEALERFRRCLSAKVAPRVALERLMLEL